MSEEEPGQVKPVKSISQEALRGEAPPEPPTTGYADSSMATMPVMAPPAPPPTPALTPEQERALRELTDSINELIAESIKIVIMSDEDECARENRFQRPCDTCSRAKKLKPIVSKILRLSESVPRAANRG